MTTEPTETDGTDFEWCFHGEIEHLCKRPHLPELARARRDAKRRFDETTEELKAAVILAATDGGMAETLIAADAQVDRMTVRKWLGKGSASPQQQPRQE
jgi:DNA invertase Pin-like site-specific DNA recombinase